MPLQIKAASNKDIHALIDLWMCCFTEDEEDYPRDFLGLVDLPTQACVGFSDGKPVTMLFLLPATARCGKECRRVRYLYAGCTHPDYRRRGYYEELMAHALLRVNQWGEEAIYLYPAKRSLVTYYERLGYRGGITCALFAEDVLWWEPEEPFCRFFSAVQRDCPSHGECLWIPALKSSSIVEVMNENEARTCLLGN